MKKHAVAIFYRKEEQTSYNKSITKERLFLTVVDATDSEHAIGKGLAEGAKEYKGFDARYWCSQEIE